MMNKLINLYRYQGYQAKCMGTHLHKSCVHTGAGGGGKRVVHHITRHLRTSKLGLQIQCGVIFFMLDSRRVLAKAAKVLSPSCWNAIAKNISTPVYACKPKKTGSHARM